MLKVTSKIWAERTFGKEYAEEIAEIETIYYKLAASGKPEHIDKIKFTQEEINKRLAAYQGIAQKAEDLESRIPKRLQDAYFELILYPVLGAANMNEKIFYAQMGDSVRSIKAFDEIKKLTDIYNEKIAGGKWNGIMSMSPRNLPVFGMPEIKNKNLNSDASGDTLEPIKTISVNELKFDSTRMHLIPGLGVDGVSLSWTKFNIPSYNEEKIDNAPTASIKFDLPEGKRIIKIVCVPTHAVYEGRALRTAISLGENPPIIVNINTPSKTDEWSKNVLRGYSTAKAEFILKKKGMLNLKLSLLDPGLAICKVIIY